MSGAFSITTHRDELVDGYSSIVQNIWSGGPNKT